MDLAAISLAIVAGVTILFLLVQFVGWVKLRFEVRASVKACESTQARAEASEKNIIEAWNDWTKKGFKTMGENITAATVSAEKANLRCDSIAESLAALTSKLAAREREEAKREKRAEKENGPIEAEQLSASFADTTGEKFTRGKVGRVFFQRKQV